ncbi:hypothetical protein ACHAXS_009890 [Conticribra weissflogii]
MCMVQQNSQRAVIILFSRKYCTYCTVLKCQNIVMSFE